MVSIAFFSNKAFKGVVTWARLTGLAHFPEICGFNRMFSIFTYRLHEEYFLSHLGETARVGEIWQIKCQISPIGPVRWDISRFSPSYKRFNIFISLKPLTELLYYLIKEDCNTNEQIKTTGGNTRLFFFLFIVENR